jgi:fructose-1,6-bisphosphatase/inositol monophosphatase family enzyme
MIVKGKVLSAEEKMMILSARCRKGGVALHELCGVSRGTVSGWMNGKISSINIATRKILIEAGGGLMEEGDFVMVGTPLGRKIRRKVVDVDVDDLDL